VLHLGVKRLFVARFPVDMRKSFNTLSDLVQFTLKEDPMSGDAYVFIGKSRNRLKVLLWEDSGFWVCAKRLEEGTFDTRFWHKDDCDEVDKIVSSITISQAQWAMLLEGIIPIKIKRKKRFSRQVNNR
jgi:transposase